MNDMDFPTRMKLNYDRIKISFLVLEVVILQVMSMSEILSRILGGTILAYPFWISNSQLTSILVIRRSMVHLCVHYFNV
jgi:hypothetical protein